MSSEHYISTLRQLDLANNYEPLAQIHLVIILSHKRSSLLNVSQFSLF